MNYQEKFSDVYDQSSYSSPLQSMVMGASHKLTERAFDRGFTFDKVLEIGAGTGEHFPFVRHNFKRYVLSDLDPKTLDVARKKMSDHPGIVFEVQSGTGLAYPDATFDRVIATHVLEHIYQPHLAIKEWCRVLKTGGCFRFSFQPIRE